MPKFIVIASGKGGVGKTTTAINLGTALSNFGRDTIVIDGNVSTPNIGIHLGAPTVPVTFNDVLNGKNEMKQAAYFHPSGLKVILSGLSNFELEEHHKERFVEAVKQLQTAAEVIIIDSAATMGDEAMIAIKAADEAIIVTTPELPSVISGLKMIRKIEKLKKKVIGVVVTRVTGDKIELSIKNIEELLEKPVIGIIPEDKNIKRALKLKHPVMYSYPESQSSLAYKKLAASLIGKQYVASITEEDDLFDYLLKRLGLRSRK